MVEYILVLTVVVVPSIAAAILGYSHLVSWYANFVNVVSQPTP